MHRVGVITCQRIPSLNSDMGVCDAARVSMAKKAESFGDEKNRGLLAYLKRHAHWSPFAHSVEAFMVKMEEKDFLFFLEYANTSGFRWDREYSRDGELWFILSGTTWAWHENLQWLPSVVAEGVMHWYRSSPRYQHISQLLFGSEHSDRLLNRVELDAVEEVAKWEPTDDHARPQLQIASFRVTAPIFVARQAMKHQIHLSWNEESRRYIDSEPKYFVPIEWRARPEESIKQGSSQAEAYLHDGLRLRADKHYQHGDRLYRELLDDNVAPELARMVLPQSMFTNWIWTGRLDAFARVCRGRLAPDAQRESRDLARPIHDSLSKTSPRTWKALMEE